MRRRTVLATLGAALAAAAGCGGRGESPTDTPPSSPEAADTPVTASPTDARTPTRTATSGDASSASGDVGIQTATEPTHGLGERFVVEGQQPVAYTFHRFARAERLGPIGREPDQGAFLVVECTVENMTRQPMAVPIEEIVLRGGVRLFARQDDTDAAAADDRVDLPPLTDETIFRGTPLRGVLAFDLPAAAGNDYYIRITPPGDAETPVHRVPVGPLESLPELS
ncbi:MAG: hypothetical protein V5A31_13455 [Haloferacaceae archaeon]